MKQERNNEVVSLRLPQHSVESEQSLLGALLLDNSAWDRIADIVSEADFYRDDHRRIFRHISGLIQLSKPADVVTVYESIEKSDEVEASGGLAYLGEIANATPSAANIRRYAEVVRERAILRKLALVGDAIVSAALSPMGRDSRHILDEAESQIFEIAESGSRGAQGPIPIQSLLGQVVDHIQELYDRDDDSGVTGVPSGFADLDEKTCGLQRGEMVIIAGRPSAGKSAFALNIAAHVAVNRGLPVAVCSMEMTKEDVTKRLLASIGMIDYQHMRSGKLNDDEWARMTVSLSKLQQSNIHIDPTAAINIVEVRARCRRLSRQHGKLGLIVIDYLQLMSPTATAAENRATQLSEITRGIKSLAMELDVPVLALSQLNRESTKRIDKRPAMSELRESGAIEQDADVVLMIYRDEVYNPESPDRGTAEIIIGKQRNGSIGTVRLAFIGEQMRFADLVQGWSPPPVPPRPKYSNGFEP